MALKQQDHPFARLGGMRTLDEFTPSECYFSMKRVSFAIFDVEMKNWFNYFSPAGLQERQIDKKYPERSYVQMLAAIVLKDKSIEKIKWRANSLFTEIKGKI